MLSYKRISSRINGIYPRPTLGIENRNSESGSHSAPCTLQTILELESIRWSKDSWNQHVRTTLGRSSSANLRSRAAVLRRSCSRSDWSCEPDEHDTDSAVDGTFPRVPSSLHSAKKFSCCTRRSTRFKFNDE